MKPILRNYQTEEDYWRIREFLRMDGHLLSYVNGDMTVVNMA